MDPVAYALLRSGLFSSFPPESFSELLSQVDTLVVASGEPIVRAGEPADAFYVVVSGAVHVYKEAPDGKEVPLADLGPGRHFGEQALLANGARLRNANVRGLASQTELARVGAAQFEVIFAHAPGLRAELEALGQRQVQEQLARGSALVRELLSGVDTRASTVDVHNGTVLFRQGQPVGPAYVVLSGAVELFEESDGPPKRVAAAGPGVCVGERDKDRHRHTAIVDGPTRLLEVPREALSLASQSPRAQDHLATLQRIWELPQRGFVTQHLGSMDGATCVTQLFHLSDGRSLSASHVIGSHAVRLQATAGEAARTLTTPDGALRLTLDQLGSIVQVDGESSNPALASVFARAIDGRPLNAAEVAALQNSGALHPAAKEENETACACMRVSRIRVSGELAAGVRDLQELSRRTGCGTVCGSCIPGLLQLLGKQSFLPIVITRREQLTASTIRILFASANNSPLPMARPGQHIVVRVNVGGQTLDRPYTLSGAAGGPWEVTVKREPGGAVSAWFCDNASPGTALLASAPQGNYIWEQGPAPVVCFASGIGITPALSFARTLLRSGLPHRLVVDWSTRHESDATVLGELASAAAPNFTLTTRYTSRAGRIKCEDVQAIARRFPTALYYLCGSDSYMAAVSDLLSLAGVPQERVHIEQFNPAAVAAAIS